MVEFATVFTTKMLSARATMNMMTERTMPAMPQILPPVTLPFLTPRLTAFDAMTMATMPRMMPTRGAQQNTMARMPHTSAPTPLPPDCGAGWPICDGAP